MYTRNKLIALFVATATCISLAEYVQTSPTGIAPWTPKRRVDSARIATVADTAAKARLAAKATLADSAAKAALAANATHATLADSAIKAASATSANRATLADSAVKAGLAANAAHAILADSATKAGLAANATHATLADSATRSNHAILSDTAAKARLAAKATLADSAAKAALAANATHATLADSAIKAASATSATNATHATLADSATKAGLAATATKATLADSAVKAALASRSTLADSAVKAASSVLATHASVADSAIKAASANRATVADSSVKASSAISATTAASATYATSSSTANHASVADSAVKAASAVSATNATYATSAGTATSATSAATATTATNSSALGGVRANRFVQGNYASRTTNLTDTGTSLSQAIPSGFYDSYRWTDAPVPSTWTHLIHTAWYGNTTQNTWAFDIAASFGSVASSGAPENYYVRTIENTTSDGWRTLIHSNNYPSFNNFTSGLTTTTLKVDSSLYVKGSINSGCDTANKCKLTMQSTSFGYGYLGSTDYPMLVDLYNGGLTVKGNLQAQSGLLVDGTANISGNMLVDGVTTSVGTVIAPALDFSYTYEIASGTVLPTLPVNTIVLLKGQSSGSTTNYPRANSTQTVHYRDDNGVMTLASPGGSILSDMYYQAAILVCPLTNYCTLIK